MHIDEIIEKIMPVDKECQQKAQDRFDALIKPLGSLAQLETMTSRYAAILGKYKKEDIDYPKRSLFVWSDMAHAKQAAQIMEGNYPVVPLAAETGAAVEAILVTALDEEEAMEEGAGLVQEHIHKDKLGLVGFGCLAGADDELVIAAMAGGILQAAAMKIPVMLDGLATCLAAQKAVELAPAVIDYCFAGHVSLEAGVEEALQKLGLTAPLRLNIPDGAGEGAAVAFTLFNAGIKSFKEMETFEEAGVHVEMKEFSLHEQVKKEKAK